MVLVPYFLSPGIHVRQDLKEFRNMLAERHPVAQFLLAKPLGRHEALIDLVVLCVRALNDESDQDK